MYGDRKSFIAFIFFQNGSLSESTHSCWRNHQLPWADGGREDDDPPSFWTSEWLAWARSEQLLMSAHRRFQDQLASRQGKSPHGRQGCGSSKLAWLPFCETAWWLRSFWMQPPWTASGPLLTGAQVNAKAALYNNVYIFKTLIVTKLPSRSSSLSLYSSPSSDILARCKCKCKYKNNDTGMMALYMTITITPPY